MIENIILSVDWTLLLVLGYPACAILGLLVGREISRGNECVCVFDKSIGKLK